MVPPFAVSLVLAAILGLSSSAAACEPDTACDAGARHIDASAALQQVIAELLVHSPTFRLQCARIAEAGARIRVIISLAARGASTRARASIGRLANGVVWADIELPPAADFAELLPHEFEHVLEQIDGVDLATRARDGADVALAADGSFETERARAAGLAAAREFYGAASASGAARGILRAFRFVGQRAARSGAAPRLRGGVHKEF
jgi:hypothetical protein